MKNSFRVIIVALLIAAPALGFAQKAYKFGHVDKREIMQVLPDRDSAIVKLQKFEKELQASLLTAQEEYQAKYQKYLEERDKLDPLIKQTKEKELQGMNQNIQQYSENAQQLDQQKQNELINSPYTGSFSKLPKAPASVHLKSFTDGNPKSFGCVVDS